MPQINELPEGFSTIINPNGKEFSRSMIQKLVLARSIADRPKLLLMDDEQSFLNDKLDHQMFSFLCANDAHWTLVAVTDNENWLTYFKQIIVMEEGKAIFNGDFKAYQIFKSK
jgi:ABC-type bacteriocin/lantibiotic exporter with double-glycine peptidase domain